MDTCLDCAKKIINEITGEEHPHAPRIAPIILMETYYSGRIEGAVENELDDWLFNQLEGLIINFNARAEQHAGVELKSLNFDYELLPPRKE